MLKVLEILLKYIKHKTERLPLTVVRDNNSIIIHGEFTKRILHFTDSRTVMCRFVDIDGTENTTESDGNIRQFIDECIINHLADERDAADYAKDIMNVVGD